MRHAFICVSLAIAALAVEGHSAAQAAPWCSTYGGTSCGYYTYQQCLDSIRGVGGSCTPNPHESRSKERAAPGHGGTPARSRTKIREEQRAREEQKAKQAAPRKERPAKPPATTAAPAKPVAPPAPATPPVAATATPTPGSAVRKPAPTDARVYFVGLQDGAEVRPEVTIRFGVTNMGVAPAGIDNPGTGHHHLLIDAKLPPLDRPIPSDFNHLHFGAGQTEATVTLQPGKHTLQLLFADENHVPHNPAMMSAPIDVIVTKTAR